MNEKKVYTEDSIQSLTPLEFTRLRPGVYVGSTEYSTQLLIEIVSNSGRSNSTSLFPTKEIGAFCAAFEEVLTFLAITDFPDFKTVLSILPEMTVLFALSKETLFAASDITGATEAEGWTFAELILTGITSAKTAAAAAATPT